MLHPRLEAVLNEPDFYFVQVGANDGHADDSLQPLIKKHLWRGLLIEPVPYVFRRLQQTYAEQPGLIFECVAISSQEGFLELWMLPEHLAHRGTWDASVLATSRRHLFTHPTCIDPEDAPAFQDGLISIQVPSTTLDRLVKKHGISKIDLLQIDTQGHDFEVMQSLNFAATKPRFVNFEHDLLEERWDPCRDFLEDMHYQLYPGLDQVHDTLAILEDPGK